METSSQVLVFVGAGVIVALSQIAKLRSLDTLKKTYEQHIAMLRDNLDYLMKLGPGEREQWMQSWTRMAKQTGAKAPSNRIALPDLPEACGGKIPERRLRRRRKSLGVARTNYRAKNYAIANISAGGALLETDGEIEVGQLLDPDLLLDNGCTVSLAARVVRIQKPEWGRIPGVGVQFTEISEETKRTIQGYVETGFQPPELAV